MTRLTKNFSFIPEGSSVYKDVVNLEKRFIDRDFDPIPNLAGKIIEFAFIEKMNQPQGMGLSAYLSWYKEMYGKQIVTDALFTVRRYRNDNSHANYEAEEITWTTALWIVKSVSIILQDFYQERPQFAFTELPYLSATQQQVVLSKTEVIDKPVSINESELNIKKTSLINWLKNENIQFTIPYYQRSYTWKETQVETLINDIEQRVEDRYQHYFGVIAVKRELIKDSEKVSYKIIDGQQRLTTSIILYKAAHDALKNRGYKVNTTLEEIFSKRLNERYKNDSASEGAKKEFIEILTKSFGETKTFEWQYGKNYATFYKYFSAKTPSLIQDFIDAFSTKFEIAMLEYEIEPEREMDIFENMNSKGTELSEWDLIRNHLLNITDKTIPDGKKVKAMEENFYNDFNSGLKENSSEIIGNFFTEYIYLNASKTESQKWISFDRFAIYNNFKLLVKGMKLSLEEYEKMLNKLWSFGIIHKSLVFKDFSKLGIVNGLLITRLNDIAKKQQLYFLVFKAIEVTSTWNGREWKINNQKLFTDFITIIHNAVLRLEITKGFGTSFRTSALYISRYMEDKNALLAIKTFIKTSDVLNSSDNDVKETLLNSSTKQDLAKSLLLLVNNFLVDEEQQGFNISFVKPSLEHVMPQSNEKWEDDLKQQSKNNWRVEYEKHLNLIGNFYVLPQKLNTKVSNSEFSKKKPELVKIKTPEILGSDKYKISALTSIDEWTFKLIKSRTQELVKLLVEKLINI